MTIAEAVAWAADFLLNHQIDEPILEAEILLVEALQLPRTILLTNSEAGLTAEQTTLYQGYIRRRANHEPTAYIVSQQPFMSLKFYVDTAVLIPRPETELLVEKTIEIIGPQPAVIADIGLGCGAIAVSLAKYLPSIKVIGTECSADALKIALNNAQAHQVENRCCFLLGNLLEPLTSKVDLIVSNPPYIPSADINFLQPEVKDWEPKGALDGGKDGLTYIRQIIDQAPKYLKTGGQLLFEFGFGQANEIIELLNQSQKFKEIEIFNDYAKIPRIAKASTQPQ